MLLKAIERMILLLPYLRPCRKITGLQNIKRALHHAEVGAALVKIRQSGAYWATKACFEFLTLTAVRSKEARLAKWSEISFKSKTWTIPVDRMKMKREHRVPLSDAALDLLGRSCKTCR